VKQAFARILRQSQTDVERKLWYALRDRRLNAAKFRRQQPIGPYVVDFVCFDLRLVIELDGSQHAKPEMIAADTARTEFLESERFRVLRFWNQEILENFDGVLEAIFVAVTAGQ
jgi:adenine-specific DNA-methyltransferase